jgi:hypothetical protein
VVLAHAFHALVLPPRSVLISYAEAAEVAAIVVKDVGEEFQALTQGTVPFRIVTRLGVARAGADRPERRRPARRPAAPHLRLAGSSLRRLDQHRRRRPQCLPRRLGPARLSARL